MHWEFAAMNDLHYTTHPPTSYKHLSKTLTPLTKPILAATTIIAITLPILAIKPIQTIKSRYWENRAAHREQVRLVGRNIAAELEELIPKVRDLDIRTDLCTKSETEIVVEVNKETERRRIAERYGHSRRSQ